MPGTCGTRATSGSRHSREMSVWARRAASECDQNAGGLPLVIQPLQPVPEDAVATKSAFIVPQDATRLNQGHCGSPEDNPVFILPASDPAPRGNPILVPWMYHDGATAGLVSRMAVGLPIQSTFKVRGCSGWPGRRRPLPETSALAQIFSGRSCYERPGRRRKSRS